MTQNPLYQNAYPNTITANMSVFGSQTLPFGILPALSNVNTMGSIGVSIPSSSRPPNKTRIENARPIFQNMPRTLRLRTPGNTVEFLVTFHQ